MQQREISDSQPTATQLFRKQTTNANHVEEAEESENSQDESISQPVIPPITKRKEIAVTPTPPKKTKMVNDEVLELVLS